MCLSQATTTVHWLKFFVVLIETGVNRCHGLGAALQERVQVAEVARKLATFSRGFIALQ